VINTSLLPILHRFRDTAFDMSKIAIFFWGRQRMANVPNAVEILPKITTVWVGCTSVTDRQTTDGWATAVHVR